MADVVLEGVSKSFGEVAAVEELSLGIADGELVVLLGPTGAGKTTTLRLVAGLERPESGRVLIDERDVTTTPPAGRDVTFVFQQYSLYPHYTVYDNLAFPLRSPQRRWPEEEIRARVEEVARILHIESKLKNKATRLSGGEMQRVAIGRALVREPAIYLMDEPLSSLDAKLRAELRVELKRIQQDLGATILYVTHDQIEAMTMADRIGVLAEGRLQQVGPPDEIYRRPRSIHVAMRLGSPQINILPAGSALARAAGSGCDRIGIRPEDLALGSGDVPATVQTVERLGAETIVRLEAEGRTLHALIGPTEAVRAGQETMISAEPHALHCFDRQGVRLAG